jgi:hypothetical protein
MAALKWRRIEFSAALTGLRNHVAIDTQGYALGWHSAAPVGLDAKAELSRMGSASSTSLPLESASPRRHADPPANYDLSGPILRARAGYDTKMDLPLVILAAVLLAPVVIPLAIGVVSRVRGSDDPEQPGPWRNGNGRGD